MLTTILIALPVLVAILAVVVVTRPNEFRVSRDTVVHAPASTVFALVNDLHQHRRWSPFMQVDPAMKTEYDGPATGAGSSLYWKGNGRAGEGRITTVASEPDTRVDYLLEFLRPFKATNDAAFTFEPQADGTRVAWSMSGRSGLMCKLFGLIMSPDKMCGREFEKGLAQLKSLSEAAAPELAVR